MASNKRYPINQFRKKAGEPPKADGPSGTLQRYRGPSPKPAPPENDPFEPRAGVACWEYCNVYRYHNFHTSKYITRLAYTTLSGKEEVQTFESTSDSPEAILPIINRLGRAGWEAFSVRQELTHTVAEWDDKTKNDKLTAYGEQEMYFKRRISGDMATESETEG